MCFYNFDQETFFSSYRNFFENTTKIHKNLFLYIHFCNLNIFHSVLLQFRDKKETKKVNIMPKTRD